MILVCLNCGGDMQEIKRDQYRCQWCEWEAEQLSIEQLRKENSYELENSHKTRAVHHLTRNQSSSIG